MPDRDLPPMIPEQRAGWDARLLAAHDEARARKAEEKAARLAWLDARRRTLAALERLAGLHDLRRGDEPLFDHLIEQAREETPDGGAPAAAVAEREALADRLTGEAKAPKRRRKKAAASEGQTP